MSSHRTDEPLCLLYLLSSIVSGEFKVHMVWLDVSLRNGISIYMSVCVRVCVCANCMCVQFSSAPWSDQRPNGASMEWSEKLVRIQISLEELDYIRPTVLVRCHRTERLIIMQNFNVDGRWWPRVFWVIGHYIFACGRGCMVYAYALDLSMGGVLGINLIIIARHCVGKNDRKG